MLMSSLQDRLQHCSINHTQILGLRAIYGSEKERSVFVFKGPKSDRSIGIPYSQQMAGRVNSECS